MRTTVLTALGCLILGGLWLAQGAEFSLIPDSSIVGQNYGYPSGTPGQGPTLPGNIDFVFESDVFAKNLELTNTPPPKDQFHQAIEKLLLGDTGGQTYIGFLAPLRLRYRVADELTVEAGAILGHNFGADNGLDIAYPLLRLVYQPDPNDIMVGGTLLDTHWMSQALYDDVHVFRRPAEQGFQYRVDREWLKEDVWINWATTQTDDRSEQFDVADSTQLRYGNLWFDGQFMWPHVGGQQNSVDFVLWLRGNFRTEWGFENQWVGGKWMNTYQVNFVWEASFHGLSRQPLLENEPPMLHPEPGHGPEEVPAPAPAAASLPPEHEAAPAEPRLAPAEAVSLVRLPLVLPPPVDAAPPRDMESARPSVPFPVRPVAAWEPVDVPQGASRLPTRADGDSGAVVFAENAGPTRLPVVTADAVVPAGPDVQAPRVVDQPPRRTDDSTEPSFATPIGNGTWVWESLPQTQLWRVPMANQREPRCELKLSDLNGHGTLDTEIGGVFGLSRVGPADNSHEGIELGAFAAVFMRFLDEGHPIAGDVREAVPLTAVDYRAGLPLMLAMGDWQMKLSYEHTSCHLGDEYMLLAYNYGITGSKTESIRAVRDESVLGIARFFGDALRLYGQFGYSFLPSDTLVGKVPVRYDWGLEYSPPVPPIGGPFAAFDMDLRAEQDFFRNITIQAGWQWKTNENRRSSARIGVEYYDGHSPYGQFFDQRESYWALVAIFDW